MDIFVITLSKCNNYIDRIIFISTFFFERKSSMNNVVHENFFFQGKHIVSRHSLCSCHVTSKCQTRRSLKVVGNANLKSLNSLVDPRYEGLEKIPKIDMEVYLEVRNI